MENKTLLRLEDVFVSIGTIEEIVDKHHQFLKTYSITPNTILVPKARFINDKLKDLSVYGMKVEMIEHGEIRAALML